MKTHPVCPSPNSAAEHAVFAGEVYGGHLQCLHVAVRPIRDVRSAQKKLSVAIRAAGLDRSPFFDRSPRNTAALQPFHRRKASEPSESELQGLVTAEGWHALAPAGRVRVRGCVCVLRPRFPSPAPIPSGAVPKPRQRGCVATPIASGT